MPKVVGGKLLAKAMPKYGAINFQLGTLQGFKNQFVRAKPATSTLPLPPLAINMLAAAINCGYGNTPGEMVTPLNFPWWPDLQKYLTARLHLLMSLLDEVSAPPNVRCTPFAPLVETTEIGDMSTLLGMLLCRVATERWAAKFRKGSKVVRFWHWKVTRDAATCMDSQVRPGIRDVNNPDFIYQLEDGWYTTEAKGTFGAEDWSDLRKGLEQARKFDAIAFNDLSANAIVQAPVIGFSCTMAYFDKQAELQVTHLDPPNQRRERSNSLKIVKEFADLVCFERAFAQFYLLSDPVLLKRGSFVQHLPEMEWRRLRHGSEAAEPIYLGMPKVMADLEQVLKLTLTALRLIVPLAAVLQDTFTNGFSLNLEHARTVCVAGLLAKARNSEGLERHLWRKLLRIVRNFLKNDGASGHDLLVILARMAIFPHSNNQNFSILELRDKLLKVAERSQNYVQLKAKLSLQNNPRDRIEVAPTDYGLLLITGRWSAAATKASKLLKI
jgi:hypothetical protein